MSGLGWFYLLGSLIAFAAAIFNTVLSAVRGGSVRALRTAPVGLVCLGAGALLFSLSQGWLA